MHVHYTSVGECRASICHSALPALLSFKLVHKSTHADSVLEQWQWFLFQASSTYLLILSTFLAHRLH